MQKYRKDNNISYTLGTTVTIELLENKPKTVKNIYFHSNLDDNDTKRKIEQICRNENIEIISNDHVFKVLSEKENCYCIGVFEKYDSNVEVNQNHIVLVNPANTGNLGTILRTSLGFGINNIAIIRPGADIFNPKTIRASMGSLFQMNFRYFDNIDDYLKINKNDIYCFMLKGSKNLSSIDDSLKFSLIFGNESSGLPEEYSRLGSSVAILHNKKIDSLNLDNAVAIALYQFTKNKFIK